MKKTLSVFLALLMVLLPMTAYAEENPTVVTVNGDSITQAELDAMMSAMDARMTQYGIDTSSENVQNAIREAAMQELVEDRLLTQDMTAQGCYDMTEEEEASIADAAKKSQADLQQQMESYFASHMDSQEDSMALAPDSSGISHSRLMSPKPPRHGFSSRECPKNMNSSRTSISCVYCSSAAASS